MHQLPILVALFFAAVAGLGATAGAMPPVPTQNFDPRELRTLPVVPVTGCHANVRRHFVPEFGRAEPHVHRRGNCRPLRAREPRREQPRVLQDCHRDARRHYVPGAGRILHRHVGRDCTIRIIRRSTSG